MGAEERGRFVLDLFDRYYGRVYCFARRSVDAPTADDVTQEVFARLLDTPEVERKPIGVSYLLKVAENIIRRRHRRERRFAEIAATLNTPANAAEAANTAEVGPVAATAGPGPDGVASALVAASPLTAAAGTEPTPGRSAGERTARPGPERLRRLSRGEADAVDLIVCRGLSYQQAAASLGVNITAVNNWKHRGLQRLRQHTPAPGAEPVSRAEPALERRATPGRSAG